MKAVIPVAGVGTRLRPHTYTQPKPLIPVAGKPLIASIIDQLVADGGITEFILVIGYLGDKMRNYIENRYPHLDITFVYQEARLGLGHAMYMAINAFEDSEEILIVLGDTIFEGDLKVLLKQPNSCLGVKKVDDPREFGVVEIGDNGYINKVVEKPRIPKSNMALVGLYKISDVKSLVEALQYIVTNNVLTIDEYQLSDALMRMVEMGVQFTVFEVDNWYDCGKKDILLDTNAMLLRRQGNASEDIPAFENTIIVHPVSIGENCQIKNSIIGPNVCIGDNSILNYAIVSNSIIGSYAMIEEAVLQKSIIGSDAAIKGLSLSLNIGDNTEIDFS
ncbi:MULTISPECIES: sugar phosphate nucleotidyltransferase [unclassified Aureispira]|uniref:sugar phosphate nucleotidyltransferase n=1 Tax=unclassified Aureispira TaxID=2649989 RepID=UPI000697EA26|nr:MULTISPECIES: sugar phosphate nucleotidyltransferase [unclassified Aureispira]WMX14319.1 sugar phosphate nucleotidyltransferase [Aureispira sp. CCB-E]